MKQPAMYTKEEASKLKQAFWTKFGQYMQPILSAEGLKTNWINYKTGINGIYFKMDADKSQASIGIVFTQHHATEQAAQFAKLQPLKTMLQNTLGEEWEWQPIVTDEYGKTVSKVSKTITGINIFKQQDWPVLISFFKQRMMALDAFWSDAKYAFEG